MTTQPETGEPLVRRGHRLVPVAKHEGSVRRWRCLDCDEEAADAESFRDRDCAVEA
jgi:hypothetical protein